MYTLFTSFLLSIILVNFIPSLLLVILMAFLLTDSPKARKSIEHAELNLLKAIHTRIQRLEQNQTGEWWKDVQTLLSDEQ